MLKDDGTSCRHQQNCVELSLPLRSTTTALYTNHCVGLTSIFHKLPLFRIIARALQNAEPAKTH